MTNTNPEDNDTPQNAGDNSTATHTTPLATEPPVELTYAEREAAAVRENPFTIKDFIIQGLLFYAASYGVSYMVNRNSSQAPDTEEVATPATAVVPKTTLVARDDQQQNMDHQQPEQPVQKNHDRAYDEMVPYWRSGQMIDAFLYITTEKNIERKILTTEPTMQPLWSQYNIRMGSQFDLKTTVEIPVNQDMLNNKPINAFVLMRKHNANIVPGTPGFKMDDIVIKSRELSKTVIYKKDHTKRNLIGRKNNDESEEKDEGLVEGMPYSYMHPNLTLSLVDANQVKINLGKEPPMILRWVHPIPSNRIINADGNGGFTPILYFNEFWHLKEHMYRVNNTNPTIKINVDFNTMSYMKFQLYTSFQASMDNQLSTSGNESMMHSTFDILKRTLLETSPYLLIITALVTVLHSVFDFLAFKNDVQFWRKKKDHAGLSFRSLILGLFFEVVIFLYLLESMEETSNVILISNGIGLAISAWKIFQAVDFKVQKSSLFAKPRATEDNTTTVSTNLIEKSTGGAGAEAGAGAPIDRKILLKLGTSVLTVKDFSSYSKIESETDKYDKIAFKYLSWVAYPLMFGYVVYSLIYKEFTSWYSFILSVLVGYVYTFGFIAMTPQLYINYKLKSVAHMPWRTFIYKSLNTFIDDLFAFVMPMPMLHRIATLRDDVIFFIYLYQRYIYRVDPNRANEFGQVGEDQDGTQDQSSAKLDYNKTKTE